MEFLLVLLQVTKNTVEICGYPNVSLLAADLFAYVLLSKNGVIGKEDGIVLQKNNWPGKGLFRSFKC